MTMRVRDVMTSEVVTITPDTDFKSIAQLLERYRINLLPVVDPEHRVVGVVSEADLLAKVEWQGRGRPGRIERWLLLEDELRKAEGTSASQVMTHSVATTQPEVTVSHAAQQMMVNHVKALPVVDEEDRLVGIVSRADLLKSFLRDDVAILREVVEDVLRGDLAIEPEAVLAVVNDGAVSLTGEVDSRTLRDMITRMVAAVPGVVCVSNGVSYRLDDQHLTTTREPADSLTYSGPPLR